MWDYDCGDKRGCDFQVFCNHHRSNLLQEIRLANKLDHRLAIGSNQRKIGKVHLKEAGPDPKFSYSGVKYLQQI